MNIRTVQQAAWAVMLSGAMSASATVVNFTGIGPGGTVNLSISGTISLPSTQVNSGIYNLVVDGVATPSLCIDVDRDSGNSSDYSYTALSSAPLSPAGPMGAIHATAIEKLWAAYFSPIMSNKDAAALQLAVWESLGDGTLGYTITATDGSISGVVAEANTMLASLGSLTDLANLEGLVSDTHQNYVVAVPEVTTLISGALLLLPFGASTLRMLRKNRAA